MNNFVLLLGMDILGGGRLGEGARHPSVQVIDKHSTP